MKKILSIVPVLLLLSLTACSGSSYPAALRDPLPGNDHHPNVTFRVALYIKRGIVI